MVEEATTQDDEDEPGFGWDAPRWREADGSQGEDEKHSREWDDDAPADDVDGAITRG